MVLCDACRTGSGNSSLRDIRDILKQSLQNEQLVMNFVIIVTCKQCFNPLILFGTNAHRIIYLLSVCYYK